MVWAYVVGSAGTVTKQLNEIDDKHCRRMDELNNFCKDRKVPRKLVFELRAFFNMAKNVERSKSYAELMQDVSPRLKQRIMCHGSGVKWVRHLPFLATRPTWFLTEVTSRMTTIMFAPKELIASYRVLFVVKRGILARDGVRVEHYALHDMGFAPKL